MWEKCLGLPSWPAGWCCNLQADRAGCSLKAMTWPGTTNIETTISGIGIRHFKHRFDLVSLLAQQHKTALMHLVEHVGRQANHGKVVHNQNDFEVNGFPVFHQARPSPDHTEVNQKDEWHGDGGVDQQPWISPLVCNVTRALCQGLSGFSHTWVS